MEKWIMENMEDKTDKEVTQIWYSCVGCLLLVTVAPRLDACATACDVCCLSQ